MASGTRKNLQTADRLRRDRQWEEALAIYQQVLRKRPREIDALVGCADVHRRLGENVKAVELLEKAVRIDGEHPAVLTERGRGLSRAGQFAEAVKVLHAAIMRDPDYVEALLEVGRIHLACFRPELAAAAFRRGLEVLPDEVDLLRLLGDAQQNSGHWQDALRTYEQAVVLADADPVLRYNLATTYRAVGRFEEALREYQVALTLQPQLVEAQAGMAEVLESTGKYADAEALVDSYIHQPATHGKRAVFAEIVGRIGKRTGEVQAAIEFLTEVQHEKGLTPSQQAQVLFQLGSLQERAGALAAAWSAYQAANELFPKTFKRTAYHEFIADLITEFSAERLASLPRVGVGSGDSESIDGGGGGGGGEMIFIVGMPRSGTSLVEQILAAHPQVYGAGELEILSRLVSSIPQRLQDRRATYPGCVAHLTEKLMGELAASYLKQVRALASVGMGEAEGEAEGCERITDKMPHNFTHLGLISRLFPRARIIHCRRDRADTCFSCYATSLSPAHSYSNNWDDLEAAYDEYLRLMAHWEAVLDSAQILTVQYEELVVDVAAGARKLIEFVGLPWADQCLRFYEAKRITITASRDTVRQPAYTTSVGRAKRFANEIAEMR